MLWWLCLASKCPHWGTSMSSFAWGTFLPPPGFLCWWQEGYVPLLQPVPAWARELAETTDTGWACAEIPVCELGPGQHTQRFWSTRTTAEEVREGAADWGRAKKEEKTPLIATAPQSLLMSTTRARTQDWMSFKLGLGVNFISLLLLWSPRHQNPRAKCCKAKTKPSPWLQQLTALEHAIIHSDEALCQELLLYKTIGYCCRWLPQQGHLGNLSKSPCECCHRIQSTAASSLCSRLSRRRIAK